MILTALEVRACAVGALKYYYYWATVTVARGGNSKGVRSLHRQNHVGNDYLETIVNFTCSRSFSNKIRERRH